VWLALAELVARGAGLGKIAFLARLLAPGDFGVMAIAMIVVAWTEHFTQTGLKDALIQKPGAVRGYLDTFWTVQVLRSVGLALLMVILAPAAGSFFDAPSATPVVRAVALVVFLRGFVNPAVVYFRKDLDFRGEFVWRSSGVLAGFVVALPAGLAFRDVRALVISVLAAQLVETVASYGLLDYRPRPRFERAQAAELFRFGRWIFSSKALGFLNLYLDSIVLGRVAGTVALGIYQLALQIGGFSTGGIGVLAHGALFPAFSRLEGTASRQRAWLRALGVISALVVPAAVFLAVFGSLVVRLVLGSQWGAVVAPLRILALAGAVLALFQLAAALLEGAGQPKLPAQAAGGGLLLLAVLLVPLIGAWGVAGAALAVLASRVLSLAYLLWQAPSGLRGSILSLGAAVRGSLVVTLPLLFAAPSTLCGPHVEAMGMLVGGGVSASLFLREMRALKDLAPGAETTIGQQAPPRGEG
jgi:O-antigen/teichoic acid export membrane protein